MEGLKNWHQGLFVAKMELMTIMNQVKFEGRDWAKQLKVMNKKIKPYMHLKLRMRLLLLPILKYTHIFTCYFINNSNYQVFDRIFIHF